jgi:hypothetical protein
MAPEQLERPLAVDHRADIYSLGVVFYEMLTGDLPLGKFSPPWRKVQVDVRLDEVVLRSLENDPARRYQQASEVKSQVETIAETPAPDASATAPAEPTTRCLRWARFPVVIEREGKRRMNWKGIAPMFFLNFGILSIVFGLVTVFTRISLWGWLGVKGWPSVVVRLCLAALFTAFEVRRVMRLPAGEESCLWWHHSELSPRARWWLRCGKVAGFVGLCFIAWIWFQVGWLTPWLSSRTGHPAVAQVASRDASSGALLATLPNGGSMELLAICTAGAAPDEWWRPDGLRLAPTQFEIKTPGRMDVPGRAQKDLVFRFVNLPDNAVFPTFECNPSSGHSTGDTVRRDGQLLDGAWPIRMAWPESVGAATIRLGICFEPWRTVSTADQINHTTTTTRRAGDPNWQVNFHQVSERGDLTEVTVVRGLDDLMWQTRIVAVDTNGVEHADTGGSGTSLDKAQAWTYTFKIPVARVREFRAQIRPLYWVEFRDVALRPRGSAQLRQKENLGSHPLESNVTRDTKSGALIANLPDGRSVELLALGEPEAAPQGWWTPDGVPLKDTTFEVREICPVRTGDTRPLDLVFRIPVAPTGEALVAFDCEAALETGGGGEARQNGESFAGNWPVQIAWPTNLQTATIRIGLGVGEWRTLSRHEPVSRSTIWNRDRANPDLGIELHSATDSSDGVQATFVLSKTDKNWNVRMIAVDTNGVEHASTKPTESTTAGVRVWTYNFKGLQLRATQEIRVQAQQVHWVQFHNVALFPVRQVPPPLKTRFGPITETRFTDLLDLDTGKLASFPVGNSNQSLPEGIAANVAWMQEHGFDAEARVQTIGFLGTRITYLDARDWDSVTPSRLRYLLGDSGSMPEELDPPIKSLPVTVGFRTREGATGILQVLAYAVGRPGATVRFKQIMR